MINEVFNLTGAVNRNWAATAPVKTAVSTNSSLNRTHRKTDILTNTVIIKSKLI